MPDAQEGVKKDFNLSFTPDRLRKQIFRQFLSDFKRKGIGSSAVFKKVI
jgi:hypothetical protein